MIDIKYSTLFNQRTEIVRREPLFEDNSGDLVLEESRFTRDNYTRQQFRCYDSTGCYQGFRWSEYEVRWSLDDGKTMSFEDARDKAIAQLDQYYAWEAEYTKQFSNY